MVRFTRRFSKLFIAPLLIACVLALTATKAAAADLPSDTEKSSEPEASTSNASTANSATAMPKVLYAAFNTPLIAGTEPATEPAARPRRVSEVIPPVTTNTVPAFPIPTPTPPPPPVVSTAPMTAGEKFGAWFHSRFMSFGAFGSSLFTGLWKELEDNDDFKEDTVGNYFADTMTRAARAYALGTTSTFYEKAVLASLFRQDPRYHRSGKTGAGAKLVYAATRVFVTQGDRCACNQPNYSFLLGGAAASVTANLWERSERTGPWHTVRRYYTHIGLVAFFNVVREFVGGQ
jgi:hypothetical protein